MPNWREILRRRMFNQANSINLVSPNVATKSQSSSICSGYCGIVHARMNGNWTCNVVLLHTEVLLGSPSVNEILTICFSESSGMLDTRKFLSSILGLSQMFRHIMIKSNKVYLKLIKNSYMWTWTLVFC